LCECAIGDDKWVLIRRIVTFCSLVAFLLFSVNVAGSACSLFDMVVVVFEIFMNFGEYVVVVIVIVIVALCAFSVTGVIRMKFGRRVIDDMW